MGFTKDQEMGANLFLPRPPIRPARRFPHSKKPVPDIMAPTDWPVLRNGSKAQLPYIVLRTYGVQ